MSKTETQRRVLPTSAVYRPGEDGLLVPERDGASEGRIAESSPTVAAVHAALRAFVSHADYPCVGAKSAINTDGYRVGVYPRLGSNPAARLCAQDLQWFSQEADAINDRYATYLAVFDGPGVADEEAFERMLWAQLEQMHRLDAETFGWDPSVSDDPASPEFSYSIGGKAFFVVGMHPGASRRARRFPFPVLVFNLHQQFERLREDGLFDRMKETIRERDEELQGEKFEALADHGTSSEARQYAGREVGASWRAPFHRVGRCPMRAFGAARVGGAQANEGGEA